MQKKAVIKSFLSKQWKAYYHKLETFFKCLQETQIKIPETKETLTTFEALKENSARKANNLIQNLPKTWLVGQNYVIFSQTVEIN